MGCVLPRDPTRQASVTTQGPRAPGDIATLSLILLTSLCMRGKYNRFSPPVEVGRGRDGHSTQRKTDSFTVTVDSRVTLGLCWTMRFSFGSLNSIENPEYSEGSWERKENRNRGGLVWKAPHPWVIREDTKLPNGVLCFLKPMSFIIGIMDTKNCVGSWDEVRQLETWLMAKCSAETGFFQNIEV